MARLDLRVLLAHVGHAREPDGQVPPLAAEDLLAAPAAEQVLDGLLWVDVELFADAHATGAVGSVSAERCVDPICQAPFQRVPRPLGRVLEVGPPNVLDPGLGVPRHC